MDLSTLPTRLLLRWDLAVRIALSVVGPAALSLWRGGEVGGGWVVGALVAALVSLSSLGPEVARWPWIVVAAVGTPAAILLGAILGPTATGGILWVFVLYLCHGVMVEAGLISQLAWFPVATAGLLASVLSTGSTPPLDVAAPAGFGSLWAVALMVVVPIVVPAPRIPVPPEALAVDAHRLRRMVRHPTLRDWLFPVMLGGLASALLLVADAVTSGFKPYWAVFALAGVLAPTAAATRRSTWETVGSTLAGVLLAGIMLWTGLPVPLLMLAALAMALVGATLMLSRGMLSKILLTPLPVVLAALALGPEGGQALSMRLVEYLLGAGVGLLAAAGGEWVSRRLGEGRPDAQADLVG